MKKLFIILMTFICNISFAQIDIGTPGAEPINKADEMKLRVAKRNVEYNGAIVGFAQLCGFDANDYGKVESLLFKNLNTVGLNHSQIDDMRETFNKSIFSIKEKNKNISKNECMLFGDEFKKIISTINGNGSVDTNKK